MGFFAVLEEESENETDFEGVSITVGSTPVDCSVGKVIVLEERRPPRTLLSFDCLGEKLAIGSEEEVTKGARLVVFRIPPVALGRSVPSADTLRPNTSLVRLCVKLLSSMVSFTSLPIPGADEGRADATADLRGLVPPLDTNVG